MISRSVTSHEMTTTMAVMVKYSSCLCQSRTPKQTRGAGGSSDDDHEDGDEYGQADDDDDDDASH